MSLFTSEKFASVMAVGTDWRDTSKAVLEQLEQAKIKGTKTYNFGFIYISDYLADDATSIVNLFRSVLGIENWIGSIGMGVIGSADAHVDKPAISALIGKFEDDEFLMFSHEADQPFLNLSLEMEEWLKGHIPVLGVVHADPLSVENPVHILEGIERKTNAFLVGGLSSSRSYHYQFAKEVSENTVSGVLFNQSVPVVTCLSQGCGQISDFYTITKVHENVVFELDNRKAIDVFQDAMRALAAKKLGRTIENFVSQSVSIKSSDEIPQEFQSLFRGQVHVALPLTQSDQKDFIVRDIMGVDAESGTFVVTENIFSSEKLAFVERDEKTVIGDLTKNLLALRERVTAQYGVFQPKAGLYYSCIVRGYAPDGGAEQTEVNLIREIIGDIPLAGFYAGGEINNARVYGYTGVLVLFL